MRFFGKIKDIFKKASRTVSIVIDSVGGNSISPDRNYENFCKETYMKNVIAFRCIDEIAKAVASVSWKLFQKEANGENKEIDDHPIIDLIKRPNQDESWAFILIQLMAYLLISGNSYLERIKVETGPNTEYPKEVFVHRPDRIEILLDNDRVFGYKYSLGSQEVIWEKDIITGQADLLQFKLFNPLNDFYGMGITEPASYEIDTSNASNKWNKKLLDNEARPGMIFSFSGNLTDKQYDKLEKSLKDKYSGANNAGKNLILEGMNADNKMSVTPYGWSPKEMDFIESNREMARRISTGFGVPAQLVGIPDATYANYKEARLAFWEDTIFYYLNLLKGELNNWLTNNDDNIFLEYDLNNIPALAHKREMLWTRAQESTFLTINEKREMVGIEAVDGGDVVFVPVNQIPLGTEEPTEDNLGDEDQEEEQDDKSKV